MRGAVSLCMIVRDEGRNLPTCLARARALSDDICIVDTGSRDDTLDIARTYGARICQHRWQDDFSRARNASLKMAQRPWVMVLDADEFVSDEVCAAIHANAARDDVGAMTLSVSDAQPAGQPRISCVLRVWRNDARIAFRHRIHEDVSWAIGPYLRSTGRRLAHIVPPIEHVGYGAAAQRDQKKKARDEALLLQCVAEDPRDLYSWFKLLELGSVHGDAPLLRRAAARCRALVRSYAAAPQTIHHFLGDLVLHLCKEAEARGVPSEQRLKLVRFWAERVPGEPTLSTLEGLLFEGDNDLARAEAAFLRALSGDGQRANRQMHEVRPILGLARVAMAGGALHKGLSLARQALQLAPYDREAQMAVEGLELLVGRGA